MNVSCEHRCVHDGKPWPSNKPKPDCRIRAQIAQTINPVTRATLEEILIERSRKSSRHERCGNEGKHEHL